MKLVVVIPAYNEEKHIANVVKKTKKYTKKVLVINDGSSDKTESLAKKAGAQVITHKKNQGYGASLINGINHALKMKPDYIITLDGDGQHNPHDIPKFLHVLDMNVDLVSGSRFLGKQLKCSWKRRMGIKALTLFAFIVSDLHMSDVQSGFRGYKASMLRKIKLEDKQMGFSVELPIKAKKLGYKFMEIPIEIKFFYNIKSFFSVFKQGIGVGLAIIKYGIFNH